MTITEIKEVNKKRICDPRTYGGKEKMTNENVKFMHEVCASELLEHATSALYRKLNNTLIGAVVTHNDLRNVVDGLSDGQYERCLAKARKNLIRAGCVFSPVYGIGLKRLDAFEVLHKHEAKARTLEKSVERRQEEIAILPAMGLPKKEQPVADAQAKQLSMVSYLIQPEIITKIKDALGSNKKITMRELIVEIG